MAQEVQRYIRWCAPSSPFFSAPSSSLQSENDQLSSLTSLPPDWISYESDGWRVFFPIVHKLRTHGWKVHISATPENALDTLRIVSEKCFSDRIAFKCLAGPREHLRSNVKEASRASSGKFITIYPSDNGELNRFVEEIHSLLQGRPGPYILSDVRFRGGPIFFRYGAFVPLIITDEQDQIVTAIPDVNNYLVKDERVPRFIIPENAEIPLVVEEAIEQYNQSLTTNELDDYKELKPLHFSNGGGVYKAVRKGSSSATILKEARPFAGLDINGRDAIAHQEQEVRALIALEGTGCAPKLIRTFTVWEHQYAELEYVEAQSLSSWRNERFPFNAVGLGDDAKLAYKEMAFALSKQIVRAVEIIHSKGVVIGDIHPGNILVKPDGNVVFIDFEDLRDQTSCDKATFNALSFSAPEGCGALEGDWYSVSRVLASLFDSRYVHATLSPAYWQVLLENVRRNFGEEVSRYIDYIAERSGSASGKGVELTPDNPPRPIQLTPANSTKAFLDLSLTRNRIAEGILSARHCIPGTIFPGNIKIFEDTWGSLNVTSGASGVLWALKRSGYAPPKEDVQWLADTTLAAMRSVGHDLGLFNGLAGIAGFLTEGGANDHAQIIWANLAPNAARLKSINLSKGLAGVGISMLSLGLHDNTEAYVSMARRVSDLIVGRADPRDHSVVAPTSVNKPGLLAGWSGVSLLWTALAKVSDNPSEYYQLALAAIRRDLAQCRIDRDGALGVWDAEKNRNLPYLGWGTAGIVYALSALCAANPEARNQIEGNVIKGAIRACSSELYLMPGLYRGRTGIIAALIALQEIGFDNSSLIEEHVKLLSDSAFEVDGNLHFAGDYLLRLSDDYGTGGAGVLCTLSCMETSPWNILPVVDASKLFCGNVNLKVERR